MLKLRPFRILGIIIPVLLVLILVFYELLHMPRLLILSFSLYLLIFLSLSLNPQVLALGDINRIVDSLLVLMNFQPFPLYIYFQFPRNNFYMQIGRASCRER